MKNLEKYFKKISPTVILFIGGLILTAGDIIATEWVRYGGANLYLPVMLFYLIGMILLVDTYKHKNIATASTILVIFNIVILFFVGIFFFAENVNVQKVVGILLCFLSIYLLEIGKEKTASHTR